jgi:hypothetical protein
VRESNALAYGPTITYTDTYAKCNAESDTEPYAQSDTEATPDSASSTDPVG